MSANKIKVTIVEGNKAPKYPGTIELDCHEVAITEEGMASGLPLVDFVMSDVEGNKYMMVLTGRIVNSISAAIKGVNSRIHGAGEP